MDKAIYWGSMMPKNFIQSIFHSTISYISYLFDPCRVVEVQSSLYAIYNYHLINLNVSQLCGLYLSSLFAKLLHCNKSLFTFSSSPLLSHHPILYCCFVRWDITRATHPLKSWQYFHKQIKNKNTNRWINSIEKSCRILQYYSIGVDEECIWNIYLNKGFGELCKV